MAGRKKRQPTAVIDGIKMYSAERTALKINPPMNAQYLRKLAREHQVPGHLRGIQWFFEPEKVVKALNERKVNMVSLSSDLPKISKKDILDDPLAGIF